MAGHLVQSSIEALYSVYIVFFRIPMGHKCSQTLEKGTSLVAQWLRICLPIQGTRVRSLVWEDPTCHIATKPMCHNY